MTTTFEVVRTHVSPYQSTQFRVDEGVCINSIKGCHYVALSETDRQTPKILITNTHTIIKELPEEVLRLTQLIVHPNSGYDHFKEDLNLIKDIPCIIGHHIRSHAVAEYCLACIFEFISQLPQHFTWQSNRNWNRPLIYGKKLWIFGFGHIGKIIAQTLNSLGANITIVDPYLSSCPFKLIKKWQEADVSKAEIIIAACGLNSSSHHLFNLDFFNSVSPKLLFINAARGKLVEEAALKQFLRQNPNSFAFLDVFEQEPFLADWHHFPQVWKTSHIAGVYQGLDQAILDFETKVISDFCHLDRDEFKHLYQNELLQNKYFQGEII